MGVRQTSLGSKWRQALVSSLAHHRVYSVSEYEVYWLVFL